MKRSLTIGCLVLASMVADARPASAGLWAWLEKFSGPGPFTGTPVLVTFCFQKLLTADGKPNGTVFAPSPVSRPDTTKEPLSCIYFDRGVFDADRDDIRGFPEIHATLNDIGGSVRLVDGLDIGAGLGWITFSNKETQNTPSKFTITPLRIVTRPLLLAFPPGYPSTRRHFLGALSIYWKETFVEGHLTGEDFGAERSRFDGNGELVRSYGFVLDVTALLFKEKWRLPR